MTPEEPAGDAGKIKKLIEEVENKIKKFNEEKNDERRASLVAFDQLNTAAVAAYGKDEFKALKDAWWGQQCAIESLRHRMECVLPLKDWQAVITDRICVPERKVRLLEHWVQRRTYCCQGQQERTREQARAKAAASEARFKALLANGEAAGALLEANAALITQIGELLDTPERKTTLYLFYFKLVPAHRQLAPEESLGDHDTFQDCMPGTLCTATWDKPYEDEPGACKPLVEPPEPARSRALPWLMPWSTYPDKLIDAWTASYQAAVELARIEAQYEPNADDLEALSDKVKKQRDDLENNVIGSLKKAKE